MNTLRRKILFVIHSLNGGGAERVITYLISHLDNEKYDISLVLFVRKGFYLLQIPDYVKIYDLNKKDRYSFFKMIIKLAILLKRIKPHIVVSFTSYANLITILAKFFSHCKSKLIITIHTYLTIALTYSRSGRIKRFLYRRFFCYMDTIVVPSIGVKQDLIKSFNINNDIIKVINNPCDIKKVEIKMEEENRNEEIEKLKPYMLAVGRLELEKGYPYLLRAFARINEKINEKLVILGVGNYESELRKLANNLGIASKVFFLGFKENPFIFMKNATIFVFPSLWESFGNVIVESMVCGVPVISTDCPSGPDEIITNGRNGILIPVANEEALADAILDLLLDEDKRKRFAERAKKRIQDFDVEKIVNQYTELF